MDASLSTTPAAEITTEEKNWAMGAHLSSLVAVFGLPFGHLIGPLIVYLIKGAQSRFVGQHARAALNYQITITLAAIVGIIVAGVALLLVVTLTPVRPGTSEDASTAIGLGMVFFWVVLAIVLVAIAIMSLIFIILGTMAAGEGRPYVYPFSIRFFKEPA